MYDTLCPRCQDVGLVRFETVVKGGIAHKHFCCGRCDYAWRSVGVGHKTESIYRRYAIVDEAMQREAAARLDAWVAAPPAAPSTTTVTALRRGNRLQRRVTR
jgi:hypothetical protein